MSAGCISHSHIRNTEGHTHGDTGTSFIYKWRNLFSLVSVTVHVCVCVRCVHHGFDNSISYGRLRFANAASHGIFRPCLPNAVCVRAARLLFLSIDPPAPAPVTRHPFTFYIHIEVFRIARYRRMFSHSPHFDGIEAIIKITIRT